MSYIRIPGLPHKTLYYHTRKYFGRLILPITKLLSEKAKLKINNSNRLAIYKMQFHKAFLHEKYTTGSAHKLICKVHKAFDAFCVPYIKWVISIKLFLSGNEL